MAWGSRFSGAVRDRGEKQRHDYRIERRELPVHPAIGVGHAFGGRGQQFAVAVLGVEIAHDAVGFPQDEVAVLDRRHQTVGVHRDILRILVAAELAAPVEALEWQAQLAATPQYFLHIGRVGSTPDLDHYRLRSWQFR